MKLEVNRNVLSILPAVATDQTRPSLTGVCFRNGNAIACNGNILIALRHDTPERGDMVIGADELKQAFSLANKHANSITAEEFYGRTELDFGSGTVRSNINEAYPGLEQITPQGEPSWEVTFKTDDLASLVAIAKKAKEIKVTLRFLGDQDSTAPILYALGDGFEYKGLIGPCRRATRDHAVVFLGDKKREAMKEAA